MEEESERDNNNNNYANINHLNHNLIGKCGELLEKGLEAESLNHFLLCCREATSKVPEQSRHRHVFFGTKMALKRINKVSQQKLTVCGENYFYTKSSSSAILLWYSLWCEMVVMISFSLSLSLCSLFLLSYLRLSSAYWFQSSLPFPLVDCNFLSAVVLFFPLLPTFIYSL